MPWVSGSWDREAGSAASGVPRSGQKHASVRPVLRGGSGGPPRSGRRRPARAGTTPGGSAWVALLSPSHLLCYNYFNPKGEGVKETGHRDLVVQPEAGEGLHGRPPGPEALGG